MFDLTSVLERSRSLLAEMNCAMSCAFLARGLEQARVDLGQHVAFLDLLTFGEQHLLQLAVDLGMDADGERRLHRAKSAQVNRHILALDDRDGDRHAGACSRTRRLRSGGSLSPIPIAGAARREGRKAGCDQNDATTARRCTVPLCHHGDYPRVSPINIAYMKYRREGGAGQLTDW